MYAGGEAGSREKRRFGEGLDASDKFRDVEVDYAMPAAPGAATDAYGWGAYPYLWGTSTTAPACTARHLQRVLGAQH